MSKYCKTIRSEYPYCATHQIFSYTCIIPNSMQSLRDLSHSEIIFQKAQSHISMVLFIAHNRPTVFRRSSRA